METSDYFSMKRVGLFIPAICMVLSIGGLGEAVDRDCNFQQHLEENKLFYVYSPGYPGYYRSSHSCQWVATTTTGNRIKLNCAEFSLPATPNCRGDKMRVQLGPNLERRVCGKGGFVMESEVNEIRINFDSSFWSMGGRFLCTLNVIKSNDNNNCRCGWKNPQRIVGGTETGVNEFPMAAGLVDISSLLLYCGATIIAERYVLTAAHCLVTDYSTVDNLAVVVGEHNVSTGADTNATQVFRTESIIIHPKYNPTNEENDIGLVRIVGKILFNNLVGPACLPFKYQRTNFTGAPVTIVGWGTLEFGGEKSDVLMKAEVNVISLEECATEFPEVNSTQLCTYKKGKDSCQFDSGGGVLWESRESRRLFLLGIISYGIGCGDDTPGVNVRISTYTDFILNETPDAEYCYSY